MLLKITLNQVTLISRTPASHSFATNRSLNTYLQKIIRCLATVLNLQPPFISAITRLTAFLNSYSPALIFSFGLPVGNNLHVTFDAHLT